ncbi:MAG: HIT family protein [Actinomycetia bacterium]|nr:HIT family protein [Actinomycetes bacterium]MCP4962679.1 HIT family protein [Actinomycetes bacterium]
MATIFTRIIDGEIPGTFVWKDPICVGFMSINPLQRGHVLVVPRVEVDHWIDLDAEVASHVFAVSKKIGDGLKKAFDPPRIGLMIAGFEVPHTHVHVLPMYDIRDLDFANAAASVDHDDLGNAANAIRAALI